MTNFFTHFLIELQEKLKIKKKFDVLVADDEQGYRDMFTYILEPFGVNVTCVPDGQFAVEKVKEKAYDLILTDVHMPLLSGPEAIKQIRLLRPKQKIVVFSSSSDPNHEFEDKALQEGAIECLFKPVDSSEIERVIKKALGADLDV